MKQRTRPNSGSIKKAASNIVGNTKTDSKNNIVLVRDIQNTPGNGLWCTNVEKKENEFHFPQIVSKLQAPSHINSDVERDIDKKIICQLKMQIQDLSAKLQSSLSKCAEAEYTANRYENNKQGYMDLVEQKVSEVKELEGKLESLENTVVNLNEALTNARKEISRLQGELQSECEKNKSLSHAYQNVMLEKERKDYQITSEMTNLMNRINMINNEKDNLLKLIRSQCKDQNVDYANNIQKIVEDKENSLKAMENAMSKLITENAELKRRLGIEETNKVKLNEIVRKKKNKMAYLKEQVKSYKESIVNYGNEVKWNQDLVSQRDSQIKVFKEKIKKLEDDLANCSRANERLKCQLKQAREREESPVEEITQVKAKPFLFGPETNI